MKRRAMECAVDAGSDRIILGDTLAREKHRGGGFAATSPKAAGVRLGAALATGISLLARVR